MNDTARDELVEADDSGAGAIRRRHIVYLSGYDPRGAQGYYEMFRRTCERSQRLWPVSVALKPPEIDAEDFAHWQLDMRGEDWQTTTHFDFLRIERFVRSDMAEGTASSNAAWAQLARRRCGERRDV